MAERRLPVQRGTSDPHLAVASSKQGLLDLRRKTSGLPLVDEAEVDLGLMNLPNW